MVKRCQSFRFFVKLSPRDMWAAGITWLRTKKHLVMPQKTIFYPSCVRFEYTSFGQNIFFIYLKFIHYVITKSETKGFVFFWREVKTLKQYFKIIMKIWRTNVGKFIQKENRPQQIASICTHLNKCVRAFMKTSRLFSCTKKELSMVNKL